MQAVPFLLELGRGFLEIPLTPFFYVAILLMYLQYRRQVSLERQLFGVRVTSAERQTILSVGYGLLGGLLTTLLVSAIGVVLNPTDFIYVWVLAVALAIFNVRFICFAYAGGILSFVSLLLNALPEYSIGWPWMGQIYEDFRALSVPHLLTLVAILHLIEAILVLLQGKEGVSPVFVQSKRGRLIGGFILQKFWVLPLAAVAVTGTGGLEPPPWWAILPVVGVHGLQVVPIPAVLGYSGVTLSRHPAEKAARTAKYLALYAIVLLLISVLGAKYAPPLLWVAALFSPIAHEFLVKWELADEKLRRPLFVKPLQGLRILAVLPGSPAESMELKSGDTITKANGMPVNSPFDLHFAMNRNSAFIKLEVMDEQGEIRFVGKPRYSGEHHGLGLILVPDDSAKEYIRLESIPIWKRLWSTLSGRNRNSPAKENY
ncbi:serine protease [Effusibacillus consociatus]|uniref:Serine protease n=1 Tax=Effusibacillus consociatus TaxID=1117041 RepID=A0ABV9Q215_9BACL